MASEQRKQGMERVEEQMPAEFPRWSELRLCEQPPRCPDFPCRKCFELVGAEWMGKADSEVEGQCQGWGL